MSADEVVASDVPPRYLSLSVTGCVFSLLRRGFVPFYRLRPHEETTRRPHKETLSHHLYSFFLRTCSKDVFFRLLIFFPFPLWFDMVQYDIER